MGGNKIYQKIVEATEEYLGPAGERFVARQIRNHLDKKPNEITSRDLTKLIHWHKLAMGLLTNDPKLVDEYVRRLEAICWGAKDA